MTGTFTAAQVDQLIGWLAANRVMTLLNGPETVRAIVSLGLSPVDVGWDPDDRGAGKAWRDLAASGRTFDPEQLARDLPLVGAGVLLDDPDNVEAWVKVGQEVQAMLAEQRRNPAFTSDDRSPASWVEMFHRAGRGLFWALTMVQRGRALGVRPDLLGFNSHVTPALLSAAAEAGLERPLQFRQLASSGFTNVGWLIGALDRGRVCPGAVIAASHTDLPLEQWDGLLPGLPARWFPLPTYDDEVVDPVGQGLLGAGYTWRQLRILADAGWTDLTTFKAASYFGKGPNRRRLAADQVVALAAVLRNARQLDQWVEALLQGNAHAAGGLPPLLSYTDDMVSAITRLATIGLKPSQIVSYRRAGCVTVLEIIEAHTAGVTPERADTLTAALPKTTTFSRARFANVQALIDAHHAA